MEHGQRPANVPRPRLQEASGLFVRGKLAEAQSACDAFLELDPEHPNAVHLAGLIAQRQGRLAEAEGLIRRSIALAPANGNFHSNLAAVLGEGGRHDEAVACLETALSVQPGNPDALNNLGTALEHLGRYDEAVEVLRESAKLRPGHPAAHVNLANSLRKRGDAEAAVAACREALRLDPDNNEALNGLGAAFVELCRLSDARACFERAVALRPGFADAHYNLAVALLAAGEYEAGWGEYAWRRDARNVSYTPQPWGGWVDADLSGKTILIRGEGGLGNVIQFVRYASLLRDRGAKVIVHCQERLVRLLKSADGVAGVVTELDSSIMPDETVMLRSLPALFATTLDRVPHNVPYLKPDAELVRRAGVFLQHVQGFRVGVCWQGSQELIHRRNRSFPSSELLPLTQIPGLRLINLQIGAAPESKLSITSYPDLDQHHGGFMDTAAIMQYLDLVVTCDTSVAHLAGALGVQVWVALPFTADWRWMLSRTDTPWYRSMALFRQEHAGHWTTVFQSISMALLKLSTNAALVR
ncbi:MAG TPA: tetratricopeptide repeat-containing glycosyltransferase family protein [Tepidisphaeraceae bacterium]|jgi:tetratricopeptide (TPR) repeat protein|nr:tetratricopeptide repeat-containing glycosyltransferase family protein [Tepidisphaeraceae bacterium]